MPNWTNIGAVKSAVLPATGERLGCVKAGSNVTVASDGTLSVTKGNVVGALGYEPVQAGNISVYDFSNGSSSGGRSYTASSIPVSYWGLVGCANCTAFIPAGCIEVEYSRDGGATWFDYGLSEAGKRNLFNETGAANVYLGGPSAQWQNTGNMLRVTVNPTGVYSHLAFAYMNCVTNGAQSVRCTVYHSLYSDHDDWSVISTDHPVSGWPGPNTCAVTGTFGGSNSSGVWYGIRFEFSQSGPEGGTSYNGTAYMSDFRLYADRLYTKPPWSYIPRRNTVYAVDGNQNAIFFAGIGEGGTLLEDKYVKKSDIDAYIDARLREKGLL